MKILEVWNLPGYRGLELVREVLLLLRLHRRIVLEITHCGRELRRSQQLTLPFLQSLLLQTLLLIQHFLVSALSHIVRDFGCFECLVLFELVNGVLLL